jgi:hypothetical protein
MKIIASVLTVLLIYALCVVLWGTIVFDITIDALTWAFGILKRLLDGFKGVLYR